MLIVGVGNRMRRDDGVGPAIADRLRDAAPPGWRIVEHNGDGAALMERWKDGAAALIADATRSGAVPGTIVRIAANQEKVPANLFHYSTHAFGVAEAVETARALGRLPGRIVVFGIEGADFSIGEGLSPEVNAAIDRVVTLIRSEIRRIDKEVGSCTSLPL